MSIEYSDIDFEKELERIQTELDILLNWIKPADKLKEGNIFVLEKDISIFWLIEFEKWIEIEIVKIIKPKEKDGVINVKFMINWDKNDTKIISRSLFIIHVCTEIVSEEKEVDTKLSILKEEEKKLKESIKEVNKCEKTENVSDEIKEQVGILLKLTKLFKKKVKK